MSLTAKGLAPLTRVDPSLAGEDLDSYYASLSAAVTAIGSDVTTLRISTPSFPNGTNTTVPSTLTLQFVGDGSILMDTGETVTINSDTSNYPIKKIFYNALAGQGTISLSDNRILTAIHAEWWGATGDAKQVLDASITIGTAVVTSATAGFTLADVGKAISFLGAGTAGAGFSSTILNYISATQVTLNNNAITSASGQVFTWGTDNAAPFAAAYAAAATYGCVLWIPATNEGFMISSFPTISKPVSIMGGVGSVVTHVVVHAKGPRLVWAGAAASMLKIQNLDGGNFQNLILDGANMATNTLELDYIHGCTFRNISCYGATSVGCLLGSSGADGSYNNKFYDCEIHGRNGLKIGAIGAGTSGGYLNSFYSLWIVWSGAASTYGIEILSGDNNGFYDPFVTPLAPGTASAYAYHIGDYTGSSFSVYNNYMYHPQLIQGTLVGSSATGNSNPGALYGSDKANTLAGVDYFAGSPQIATLTVTSEGLGETDGWSTMSALKIGPTLRFQATKTTAPGTTIGGFTADGKLNVLDSANNAGSIFFGHIPGNDNFELKTGQASGSTQYGAKIRRGDDAIDAPLMCSQIIPTNKLTYSGGETTPTASNSNFITFSNGGATTVTNILAPEATHILYVLFTTGNTTIQNNANIILAGGVDFVGSANDILQLVWMGTSWREVSRSSEPIWQAWTPTWTNLTLGNGTVVARYTRIGKTVYCRLSLVFGSTTSISGSVSFSLPVTRAAFAGSAGVTPIGQCRMFDTSGALTNDGIVVTTSTTTGLLAVNNSAATYLTAVVISSTVPFTWATGDEIGLQISYEAA